METDSRQDTQPRLDESGPNPESPSSPRCPVCQSEVRRSRRRGLRESLMRFIGIKPYRCENCNWRFLASANGNGK